MMLLYRSVYSSNPHFTKQARNFAAYSIILDGNDRFQIFHNRYFPELGDPVNPRSVARRARIQKHITRWHVDRSDPLRVQRRSDAWWAEGAAENRARRAQGC